MQNENTRSTSQRKQFKNIILIACALVMGILLVWAYASMLAEFFSVGDNNDGSNNNISSNDNMNMKKEAVREIYKAYLEDKYSGTYYEGEFVVDGEIFTGGTLYPNGFGTYAYRADIPELIFFMRSSISGAAIEDYFWQTHIAWEGAQEMGDVITDIYGEDMLYKVNAVCTEATAFEREGYSNLVSHYAEDGSYPHIEVVVFTDEFDQDKACLDAIELYEAFVRDKSEDCFVLDILYSRSNDNRRGGYYAINGIVNFFWRSSESHNRIANIYVNHDAENDFFHTSGYASLTELFTSRTRLYNEEDEL